MDYELTLFDRIQVIQETNKKYDLEHNAYLSFSGGKDSTVLHYLLDKALPNNRIPRVFIDTGIEYQLIRDFVMSLAKDDDRFVILKPATPVIPMLKEYGYPFKSKQHSHDLLIYQTGGMTTTVKKYLGIEEGNNKIKCPKKLRYQFTEDFNLKVSDNCCRKMKKEPVHKWEKMTGRTVAMTGMRRTEGGQRASIKGCILTNEDGTLKKFHPLLVVDDEWEDEFITRERERVCDLYLPPYNFKRTGCKGCPFSLNLQEDLDTMERLLPNERKQCETIWKPVYDEYRRIGYRLKQKGSREQLSLLEEDYE